MPQRTARGETEGAAPLSSTSLTRTQPKRAAAMQRVFCMVIFSWKSRADRETTKTGDMERSTEARASVPCLMASL